MTFLGQGNLKGILQFEAQKDSSAMLTCSSLPVHLVISKICIMDDNFQHNKKSWKLDLNFCHWSYDSLVWEVPIISLASLDMPRKPPLYNREKLWYLKQATFLSMIVWWAPICTLPSLIIPRGPFWILEIALNDLIKCSIFVNDCLTPSCGWSPICPPLLICQESLTSRRPNLTRVRNRLHIVGRSVQLAW